MSFTYPHTLTNGATADADEVMGNFNEIKDYLDAGSIVEADMTDKFYRQAFTFTSSAPAAAFDFGMIMVPPVPLYSIVESMSIGVEAIGGNTITATLEVNGSTLAGTPTCNAAGPVLLDSAAVFCNVLSGATLKVKISGAFAGVTNLTVCVFLKQIIKGA